MGCRVLDQEQSHAEMQIPSLPQEVPKPGFPEAAGAPVGCSTLQVCAHLTQLPGEAGSWATAPGETPLMQAVPCAGTAGNYAARSHRQGTAEDPTEHCLILEVMPLA